MIDDIRNWFGDLASGKIKDAHIALTEAQLADFRLRLDNLISEMEVLREQNISLREENVSLTQRLAKAMLKSDELQEQVEAATRDKDRMDKECEEILFLLFDTDKKFTIDAVTKHFGFHPSVTKAHFDTLRQKQYVWARAGVVTDFAPSPPASYELTSEGREYAMKHRKK